MINHNSYILYYYITYHIVYIIYLISYIIYYSNRFMVNFSYFHKHLNSRKCTYNVLLKLNNVFLAVQNHLHGHYPLASIEAKHLVINGHHDLVRKYILWSQTLKHNIINLKHNRIKVPV